MPVPAFLAVILMLSASASAAEIALKNPGFEEAMAGKRIPGWSRTQHAGVRAYEITTDTKSFEKGKSSIRMSRTTEQAYGLISQQLETAELAGKPVELTAALKSEDVGKKGWVMVLTFKRHSNILDQVRADPVTGDMEWTDVVIRKTAPPDTSHVEIGFLLLDGGTGWADNVRLRTLGSKDIPEGTGEADADESPGTQAGSIPTKRDSKPAGDRSEGERGD